MTSRVWVIPLFAAVCGSCLAMLTYALGAPFVVALIMSISVTLFVGFMMLLIIS